MTEKNNSAKQLTPREREIVSEIVNELCRMSHQNWDGDYATLEKRLREIIDSKS